MKLIKKYWQIFVVSLAEIFAWKLNFVLWRVRTVFLVLLLYFLWSAVYANNEILLGYDRSQMLTYVFLVAFLRSLVLSSRSIDVAGEIREGDLTNLLLRPVSYVGWWWSRDIADKVINICFAIVELTVIYLIFRPPIFFQTNMLALLLFASAALLALILYFYLSFLVSLAAFWIAEVWGIRFLIFIMLDFFAGALFPLDILPKQIFTALEFTPFPYLLFFPVKLYLGQLGPVQILQGFMVLSAWIILVVFLVRFSWARGLRTYGGEGR